VFHTCSEFLAACAIFLTSSASRFSSATGVFFGFGAGGSRLGCWVQRRRWAPLGKARTLLKDWLSMVSGTRRSIVACRLVAGKEQGLEHDKSMMRGAHIFN
jgi:hypothetical protein